MCVFAYDLAKCSETRDKEALVLENTQAAFRELCGNQIAEGMA